MPKPRPSTPNLNKYRPGVLLGATAKQRPNAGALKLRRVLGGIYYSYSKEPPQNEKVTMKTSILACRATLRLFGAQNFGEFRIRTSGFAVEDLAFCLGHFQVGSYRYRSLIEGLYSL